VAEVDQFYLRLIRQRFAQSAENLFLGQSFQFPLEADRLHLRRDPLAGGKPVQFSC
jgi:hypothetical protein